MAEIRTFLGIHFSAPAAQFGKLIAPPYDVISPELQQTLYDRDPRNIVRVVLNQNSGEAAYLDAAQTFRNLRTDGTLVEDKEPAYYLLEQAFSLEDRSYSRLGLLARFRAEDPNQGRILPHEHTRKGPREDRYRLLEATRANFSPIFLMLEDHGAFAAPAARVAQGEPFLSYTDDSKVRHRVFRILDRETQDVFTDILSRSRAIIADGHHRYATALKYGERHPPEGTWTFGYFTPIDGEGLRVLPYHRLLKCHLVIDELERRLRETFEVRKASSLRQIAEEVAASKAPYVYGFSDGRSGFVADSQPSFAALVPQAAPPSLRILDAFALHETLLSRILPSCDEVEFHHSLAEVDGELGRGAGIAVLMRPTPIPQIVGVAEAGESMPPKSTFFYPKIPSGLVIHPLPD